ncbi:MAG: AraC family transcriptional regulator [Elainellaceae cyanobacterium]
MTLLIGDRRTYPQHIDTHSHSYAQLIVPLWGTLNIATPTHQLHLGCDRLFFLPPKCLHRFHSHSRNEFLVLDIDLAIVPQLAQISSVGGQVAALDERWQAWRSLLLAEIDGSTSPHLTPLVRYACDRLDVMSQQRPPSVQYLHDHIAEPLNLKVLAAQEGYTPTYFSEWFKQCMGRSPQDYLQHLRLERAAELLQHTDWAIAHVASEVGYAHGASLTRLFQRHYGRSPLAHRRLSRNAAKNA